MGTLSTADQDNGQSYSYTLLDGAGGRFKIQGNVVKVLMLRDLTKRPELAHPVLLLGSVSNCGGRCHKSRSVEVPSQ